MITKEQFFDILVECGEQVADQFYPKNDTVAHGGEPSANGRRGEFLRDLGVLGVKMTDALFPSDAVIGKSACFICRHIGRFQRGPMYWLLRRHLRRVGK